MRWILWSGGERNYGDAEPGDSPDSSNDYFMVETDTRDHPRRDTGDNFIWKLLIFPFRPFITEKGDVGIGYNAESYAPIVGMVSAEKMDKTSAALGEDGAMEYYDKKFKSRKPRR